MEAAGIEPAADSAARPRKATCITDERQCASLQPSVPGRFAGSEGACRPSRREYAERAPLHTPRRRARSAARLPVRRSGGARGVPSGLMTTAPPATPAAFAVRFVGRRTLLKLASVHAALRASPTESRSCWALSSSGQSRKPRHASAACMTPSTVSGGRPTISRTRRSWSSSTSRSLKPPRAHAASSLDFTEARSPQNSSSCSSCVSVLQRIAAARRTALA